MDAVWTGLLKTLFREDPRGRYPLRGQFYVLSIYVATVHSAHYNSPSSVGVKQCGHWFPICVCLSTLYLPKLSCYGLSERSIGFQVDKGSPLAKTLLSDIYRFAVNYTNCINPQTDPVTSVRRVGNFLNSVLSPKVRFPVLETVPLRSNHYAKYQYDECDQIGSPSTNRPPLSILLGDTSEVELLELASSEGQVEVCGFRHYFPSGHSWPFSSWDIQVRDTLFGYSVIEFGMEIAGSVVLLVEIRGIRMRSRFWRETAHI